MDAIDLRWKNDESLEDKIVVENGDIFAKLEAYCCSDLCRREY